MTEEQMDPYKKWLGIPPEDQPPNHYRLLGIERFEADPDVISNAADGRMIQVKNLQTGEHSELSQKVLNEIAAARVCLLNAEKKARYDEQLRREPREEGSATAAVSAPAGPADVVSAPRPVQAIPDIEAVDMFASVSRNRDKRGAWHILIAVVLGLVAAVGIFAAIVGFGDSEDERVAMPPVVSPEESEEEATQSIPVPPSEETDETQPDEQPTDESTADEPGSDEPSRDEPSPETSEQSVAEPVEESVEKEAKKLLIDAPAVAPSAVTEQVGRALSGVLDPVEAGSFVAVSFAGSLEDAAESASEPEEKDARNPVPGKPERQAAEKKIREIYEKEFAAANTPRGKAALVAALTAQADKSLDEPTARFVLLQLACSAATDAGQTAEVLKIVDQMHEAYKIDALAVKGYYLKKIIAIRQAGPDAQENARFASQSALQLAETAAADDNYASATIFTALAKSAARKAADAELTRQTTKRANEIDSMRRRYTAVAKALETLADNPDDPDANLRAGRWYCFIKSNWEKGLPLLAKSEDPLLASLAEKDLAAPVTAADRKSLGDAWRKLADKEKGPTAKAINARTAFWYEQALPDLTSLDKVGVRKWLESHLAAPVQPTRKDGGVLQAGNVALASNGTVVTGCRSNPEKIIDGNSTKFTSYSGFAAGSCPCQWDITFAKEYQLREIRIMLWDKDDRYYRYAVATSFDGKTFVPLVDRSSGEWRGWQKLKFEPRKVKVIRLFGTHNSKSKNSDFHVVELEAYCIPPK